MYRQYQPQRLYFGIGMFFYKTLMSVLLVILQPESAEQLVCVIVVENALVLFVAKQQPFLSVPTNAVVFGDHLFLLVMLGILHPLHVLTQQPAVGIVMVVLTAVFLVVCAAVVALVLQNYARSTRWYKALMAKLADCRVRREEEQQNELAVVSPREPEQVVARRPSSVQLEDIGDGGEVEEMSPDFITLRITASAVNPTAPRAQQDIL